MLGRTLTATTRQALLARLSEASKKLQQFDICYSGTLRLNVGHNNSAVHRNLPLSYSFLHTVLRLLRDATWYAHHTWIPMHLLNKHDKAVLPYPALKRHVSHARTRSTAQKHASQRVS
jgi:hypothetical protein